MLAAVSLTIAAVLSLISFLFFGSGRGLVLFKPLTAGILAFAAIANWVVYFTKYVDFKSKSQLRENDRNSKRPWRHNFNI